MSFKINQENLYRYLDEQKLNPNIQKETGTLYVVLNISGIEIPVFFGIPSNGALIQTIAYLPYQLQKNSLSEIARLFHKLNKEIDMPGFGMDEVDQLMFYRLVIPCLDHTVEGKLVKTCVETTRVVCDMFLNAIAMILSGEASIDNVLKEKK
ncbi:MAG: YbjN domain-containing protein [Chlamydiales bacterium]